MSFDPVARRLAQNAVTFALEALARAGLGGGGTSALTNTPSIRTVTNGEAFAELILGAPVYASAADTVMRAQANSFAAATLVGLCYDNAIAAGALGNIASSGVLVGIAAQWDAVVTGASGGLAFGAMYFLDPANPGMLTSTPPTAAGQMITRVGTALSATELELSLGVPIAL